MLPLLIFLLILPVAAFELFESPLPTAIQGGNLERKNRLTHAAIPLITKPAQLNADLLLKRSPATCGYISGNAGTSSISPAAPLNHGDSRKPRADTPPKNPP